MGSFDRFSKGFTCHSVCSPNTDGYRGSSRLSISEYTCTLVTQVPFSLFKSSTSHKVIGELATKRAHQKSICVGGWRFSVAIELPTHTRRREFSCVATQGGTSLILFLLFATLIVITQFLVSSTLQKGVELYYRRFTVYKQLAIHNTTIMCLTGRI